MTISAQFSLSINTIAKLVKAIKRDVLKTTYGRPIVYFFTMFTYYAQECWQMVTDLITQNSAHHMSVNIRNKKLYTSF